MRKIDGSQTRIHITSFVARSADVVGDVEIGEEANVWFQAVIRGDVERIRIGARTNIQDGCIIHADEGFPCLIDAEVTVGHRCVIHGAQIGRRVLVGMGAVVMNGAKIGDESIIGAGALVPQNREIPPRSLVLGAPAKIVRTLTEDEVANIAQSAAHYVDIAQEYKMAGYQKKAGR